MDWPAGQPAIFRLEGRVTSKDLLRMARVLFEDYLESFKDEIPKMICIDMDPSAHRVYGQQQLGLFNTHVGDTCLMPFYIFDGINGRLMSATLRPGKTPTAPASLYGFPPSPPLSNTRTAITFSASHRTCSAGTSYRCGPAYHPVPSRSDPSPRR